MVHVRRGAAAYQRGGLDGIGFVLHRTKAEDGKEEQAVWWAWTSTTAGPGDGRNPRWAQGIIRELDTYAEVSPVGDRRSPVPVRATCHRTAGRKATSSATSRSRDVTVTGAHIEHTPAIDNTAGADSVRSTPASSATSGRRKDKAGAPGADGALEDAELIRRASQKRRRAPAKIQLALAGRMIGYNSPSEADLSVVQLPGFLVQAPPRIASPTCSRRAACSARNGTREDYRRRTIAKALAGRTEFYTPRGRAGRNGAVRHGGNGQAPHKATGGCGPTPTASWTRSESPTVATPGSRRTKGNHRRTKRPPSSPRSLATGGTITGRRSSAARSSTATPLGRDVKPSEATFGAPAKLLDMIAHAADAADHKGKIDRDALPGAFPNWAACAWAQLLLPLTEEEDAEEVSTPAGESFRAAVGAVLHRIVTLGREV